MTVRTITEFTPGQTVRIVEQPRSITPLQAGKQGTYLGPHLVEDGLVWVALFSGCGSVPDAKVLLRAFDLEEVGE